MNSGGNEHMGYAISAMALCVAIYCFYYAFFSPPNNNDDPIDFTGL